MRHQNVSPEELLIGLLASHMDGARHVAVGAASPIPGSAAILKRKRDGMRVTVLQSLRHNHFTSGGQELFDMAAQGRIDIFFLGGVQIDGEANINLVGTGDYPRLERRFPGSFGSSFMYFAVPKVILFREEHSPRVLVEKVDFISAPGVSPPEVWRRGGPYGLVTNKCFMRFDRAAGRFTLETTHPGVTLEEVRDLTGFDFDVSPALCETPSPSPGDLALMRGEVAHEIAQPYPAFARRVWGVEKAA